MILGGKYLNSNSTWIFSGIDTRYKLFQMIQILQTLEIIYEEEFCNGSISIIIDFVKILFSQEINA